MFLTANCYGLHSRNASIRDGLSKLYEYDAKDYPLNFTNFISNSYSGCIVKVLSIRRS